MISFKKQLLLVVLWFCISPLVLGQSTTNLAISLPLNRAVYQRNQAGISLITVKGTYEKQVDQIEARLIPLDGYGNAGAWANWNVLQTLPLNRNFKGVMTVNQGWYRLELRGVLNGTVVGDIASVSKVGVGEVFVIAGQSNAQGMEDTGSIYGATSDLVNCLDLQNDRSYGGNGYINYTSFSQLGTNARIAPRGLNSWCWGRLGDYLVQRLKVPVLFFNAAFEGTSVQAWSVTAEGGDAANPWVGGYYADKQPYRNLHDVISYFVSQLGVRSVLWHQGEMDNYFGTSGSDYVKRLQTVINKSRSDSGKDISWMVALATAYGPCGSGDCPYPVSTSQTIINAQTTTIANTSNVFLGPNTDNIQNPSRRDGAHFHDEGLVTLAQAWNNSLTDGFFSASKPQLPTILPDINYTCKANAVEVSLPSGYKQYIWASSPDFNNTTFSTAQTLTVSQDKTYYVRLVEQNENVVQIPAVTIKVSNPVASVITATRPTTFCDGDSTVLSLPTSAVIYNWSTGNKTAAISVKKTGAFSGYFVDNYGCISSTSPTVNVVNNALPSKPVIVASIGTVFCADTSTVLKVTNTDASAYVWSTGEKINNLKVASTGTFSVKTLSKENCFSPESDKISIKVNALPATPVLSAIGATTFCLDTNVTLVSTNVNAVSYRWNSLNDVSQKVTLRRSGTFSVKTIDANSCVSKSSNTISLVANPLPEVPKVAALKDTVFCDGSNTILQLITSAGTNTPVWQMQQNKTITLSNTNEITVASNGIFKGYQIDANQCKSALSSPIYVTSKANPAALSSSDIIRVSPYTVGIASPSAQEYSWKINDTPVNAVASSIRFAETATISVYAKVYYPLANNRTLTCSTSTVSNYFELYDDDGVSMYPNPTKGLITIDSKRILQNATVELYNILGERVYSTAGLLFDNTKTFDLSKLSEGTYILHIVADYYSITKRIIINR